MVCVLAVIMKPCCIRMQWPDAHLSVMFRLGQQNNYRVTVSFIEWPMNFLICWPYGKYNTENKNNT